MGRKKRSRVQIDDLQDGRGSFLLVLFQLDVPVLGLRALRSLGASVSSGGWKKPHPWVVHVQAGPCPVLLQSQGLELDLGEVQGAGVQ